MYQILSLIMISKAKIRYINSLSQKKFRNKDSVFVAEGPKVVGDLLAKYSPKILVHTEEWMCPFSIEDCEDYIVSNEELRKISFLQHPQEILAVFYQSNNENSISVEDDLVLALDGVQDPGNMGTIIRIADWFGITQIICSYDTVDVYNPKVVQATMGSIAHVNIKYVDLLSFLKQIPNQIPVYGTFLDGEDIYQKDLQRNGVIIMGNEGNGIKPSIATLINERLLIPNFNKEQKNADSLNVAIATAITCSEFRRRYKYGKK